MILTDEQVKDIKERLGEIRDKKGPYSMNVLTHAENVIESNSEHAIAILKILEGNSSQNPQSGKGSG